VRTFERADEGHAEKRVAAEGKEVVVDADR
jgi:hypothetical protein